MARIILLIAILAPVLAGCSSAAPAAPSPAQSVQVTAEPAAPAPNASPMAAPTTLPYPTARSTVVTVIPLLTWEIPVTPTAAVDASVVAGQAQGVRVVGHLGGQPGPVARGRGSLVFLGTGPELAVMDVSDAAHPSRPAYVLLPDMVMGIDFAGDSVLVAAWSVGLWVVDVSNPALPAAVASFDVPGDYNTARDVAVDGDVAYLAADDGLYVLDVREPAALAEIAFFKTPGAVRAAASSGKLAVAGGGACTSRPHYSPICHGTIDIIDVSVPQAPSQLASLQVPAYAGVADVAVDGTTLYAAGGPDGLWVYDISNPSEPITITQVPGDVRGVAVSGRFAYLAGADGLRVLDVSDPAAPRSLGAVPLEAGAAAVAADGYHAFLSSRGLAVVDISDRARPALAGAFEVPIEVSRVAAYGVRAYTIGMSGRRLSVVDLSHPSSPVQVGSYDTPRPTTAVAATFRRAYVADGDCAEGACDGQVWLLDTRDPAHPTRAGVYDPPGFAVGLKAIAESLLYVAARDQGVGMMDVKTLSAPRETAWYNTPGWAMDVDVAGGLAFVAAREGGLGLLFHDQDGKVIDQAAGAMPDEAWGVAACWQDFMACVATRAFGLRIVEVSPTPASMVEVGSYQPPDYAQTYDVESGYAEVYLAAGAAGLRVVDIADPKTPREIGSFDTPYNAEDVALAGDQQGRQLILVADGPGGLFVLAISPR